MEKLIGMIKTEAVKYQISSKQQNQVVQQISREQHLCLLLVIVLCSLKLVQIIMVLIYMSASNELIFFELVM